MDQPSKTDKFSELSPVLELVYVMLTNMAKYLDVYATDIEADKTTQYNEAKDALKNAIKKFDVLYGLESTRDEEELEDEQVEERVETPAEQVQMAQPERMDPEDKTAEQGQAYDFASGNDPESLKKAKQAVEELKTLFADMKKQEAEASANQANPATQEVPVPTTQVTPPPVPQQDSMPTFVSATTPTMTPTVPVAAPAPMQTPVEAAPSQPPAPAPQAPAQDVNEIDSILAELKKLQNKGTQQL